MRVIAVNHHWQQDYTKLQEEHNTVKANLITAEKRCEELERENHSLVRRLRDCSDGINMSADEAVVVTSPTSPTLRYTFSDIEALKQQVMIYKEDFLQEKNDHQKVNKEHNKLKLELQHAQTIIDKLNQKNTQIKESYRRVSLEKEHIVQELRKLSKGTAAPPACRVPFLPYSYKDSNINNNGGRTMNFYTVKQHSKFGSDEALKAEEATARRRKSCDFYGGYVERDCLTLTAKVDGNQSA